MPLEDLLVDEAALDREALGSALSGILLVTTAGDLRPGPKWSEMSEQGKVVAALLGAKAAMALGKKATDSMTPAEVSSMSGVASGTTRRVLRELAESRVVRQDQAGRYSVTNMRLSTATAKLHGPARRGR